MRERKAHVGLAELAPGEVFEDFFQLRKTVRRKRREQRVAVREMAVGRVVRDARAARGFAHAQARETFFFDQLAGRLQHRCAKSPW